MTAGNPLVVLKNVPGIGGRGEAAISFNTSAFLIFKIFLIFVRPASLGEAGDF